MTFFSFGQVQPFAICSESLKVSIFCYLFENSINKLICKLKLSSLQSASVQQLLPPSARLVLNLSAKNARKNRVARSGFEPGIEYYKNFTQSVESYKSVSNFVFKFQIYDRIRYHLKAKFLKKWHFSIEF